MTTKTLDFGKVKTGQLVKIELSYSCDVAEDKLTETGSLALYVDGKTVDRCNQPSSWGLFDTKNAAGQPCKKICGLKFAFTKPEDAARYEAFITEAKDDGTTAEAKAFMAWEAGRPQRRNAIPGLLEIEAAQRAWAEWHEKWEKSFDDVGGLGVGPQPNTDIEALKEKYPAAAACLKAERRAYAENYEIATIGKKAMNRIIDNPGEYAAAIADMETELDANTRKHFWD